MIKKKAGGVGTLGVVILTLVVFLVLFPFTGIFASIVTKGGDIEACRLSVLAQAQKKIAGQTFVSLKCPRKQLKFFDDGVEINDGEKEPKYKFKKLDDEAVNRVIAEELWGCWDMMGRGKLDVFRNNLIGLGAGDNVCIICAEMSFDKSVGQKQFKGLIDYLKGEKILGKDDYYWDELSDSQKDIYLDPPWIGKIPYTNYLMAGLFGQYSTTTELLEMEVNPEGEYEKQDPVVDTSKEYVVFFSGFKPKATWKFLGWHESAYYIVFGSPAKAVSSCKRLVN